MARIKSSSKIGVVFSSGFFGFFAHGGFLAAVRELQIEPSGYAGTSSGAILAAMAASEMTDIAIKEILFNLKKSDYNFRQFLHTPSMRISALSINPGKVRSRASISRLRLSGLRHSRFPQLLQ